TAPVVLVLDHLRLIQEVAREEGTSGVVADARHRQRASASSLALRRWVRGSRIALVYLDAAAVRDVDGVRPVLRRGGGRRNGLRKTSRRDAVTGAGPPEGECVSPIRKQQCREGEPSCDDARESAFNDFSSPRLAPCER